MSNFSPRVAECFFAKIISLVKKCNLIMYFIIYSRKPKNLPRQISRTFFLHLLLLKNVAEKIVEKKQTSVLL